MEQSLKCILTKCSQKTRHWYFLYFLWYWYTIVLGFLSQKSLNMIENGEKVFFPILQIRADFKGINFIMLRIRLDQTEIAVRKLHL